MNTPAHHKKHSHYPNGSRKEKVFESHKVLYLEFAQEETKFRVSFLYEKLDDLKAAMNQRFEAVDRRFEELKASMNQRFEAIERRFVAVDKRLDRIDKRFDSLNTTLRWGFGLVFTFFLCFFGIFYQLLQAVKALS